MIVLSTLRQERGTFLTQDDYGFLYELFEYTKVIGRWNLQIELYTTDGAHPISPLPPSWTLI